MKNVKEIQNEIQKTLAHIETISKVARFENVNIEDAIREIESSTSHLKNMSYTLSLMAVAS